ncbi:MlaD family protein [Segniliparus rugosus]|uniref:Mammalian cell entry related domain protein n=1 Tax=Segniliparus rugosus (strain ATCC BAA-974 / DSM 45345 / CCUG 50838 / CIP 108380 / JCM 13579 / CDC 945) TaxID=679197 RepID=E5XTQ8_SEGRC|nr:hypothetical protein [Segniliparus rugosus]EFV12261.1 hypothetical protein HMPREF9336_02880 [Segniliparus rugosus ATCC BAA-974]
MAVYQDLSGRAASMRALFFRGVVTILALCVGAVLLHRTSQRQYDTPFTLTLLTESIGEGVLPGSEVKYCGYTIGSVQDLVPLGSGGQKMVLVLDGPQAAVLSSDTSAKFIPSNSLGTSSVELLSSGHGPRLASGATLRVRKDENAASLTHLLRGVSEFQRSFDQSVLDHAASVFRKNVDLVGPVAQAVLDTGDIVSILGRYEKVSQSLTTVSSLLNGLSSFVPVMAPGADKITNSFSWLAAPGIGDSFDLDVFRPLDAILVEGNDLIMTHQEWVIPLARGILNIVSPMAYALGSLAPEYSRLPSLIDKSGALFALAQGETPQRFPAPLDVLPGLGSALPNNEFAPPGAAQGAVPSSPAPQSNPTTEKPSTEASEHSASDASEPDDDEHE